MIIFSWSNLFKPFICVSRRNDHYTGLFQAYHMHSVGLSPLSAKEVQLTSTRQHCQQQYMRKLCQNLIILFLSQSHDALKLRCILFTFQSVFGHIVHNSYKALHIPQIVEGLLLLTLQNEACSPPRSFVKKAAPDPTLVKLSTHIFPFHRHVVTFVITSKVYKNK